MSIIDRRTSGGGKSAENRRKFLKRYKRNIKRNIHDNIRTKKIKDGAQDVEVTINRDNLDEPQFQHDPRSGKKDYVLPGNKEYARGEKVRKPTGGGGRGSGGSPDGGGEDDFTFTLTKEEFIEIYFSDMGLPNFIKEAMKGSDKFKLKKAGYSKDGIPARLNVKKTMEQAIARRIATKAQNKKPAYLDDVDLRYDYFTKKPYPIKQAVMFCIMDVSGSMGEHEKKLAKKFFLLLYLFLEQCYDNIEVRFIRHAELAKEVDENTFFYSTESGGTIVSSAFQLVNEIIKDEINLSTTNIYVAQASDGDNWAFDDSVLLETLKTSILPKVQYLAYLQTETNRNREWKKEAGLVDIFVNYEKYLAPEFQNLGLTRAHTDADVYPALRSLFERGSNE